MEQLTQSEQASTREGNLEIRDAHPVLGVIVGSTLAELPLILKAQSDVRLDQVPSRQVVIDSLPYEDLRTRVTQSGWTSEQFERALPRSSFFHLTSPFTGNFDFDNPMNRSYAEMTSDPGVRRAAKQPDAPGCAGIPVLARARVESNIQELRDFLESHLQDLTRVRRETLALRSGVLCFILTTYRGATGNGASARIAAILRSAIGNNGEVHLRALMPCIYRGDNRAHANAFAAMVENQFFHRFKGGIRTKDGKSLPPPFDSAVYVFGSNRKQALGATDALMQLCSIMGAYTRVATQSSILARRVDLADVMQFDHEDSPTHVAQEASLSVCAIPAGVNEYVVSKWVELELTDKLARFNEWCQTEALSAVEETHARKIAERVVDELNLTREHLLTRLDLNPSPMNTLRVFMEKIKGSVGSMQADVIRSHMKLLPTQIQERFVRFDACWSERAIDLAKSLPEEVLASVRAKTQATPHIELAVMTRLRAHLLFVASEARSEAEKDKTRRASAGGRFGTALNSVQEARGLFGFIREDEVTRDAADKACDIALEASLARAQQERNEHLVRVLADGLSVADGRGALASVSSVTLALVHAKIDRVVQTRQMYDTRRDQLGDRLNAYGQRIQKRSPVFQRTLMFDGVTLEQLDEIALNVRKHHPEVPGIHAYLEGRQEVTKTLLELMPLLPTFTDAGRSITEMLHSDLAKRNQVVQLLRSCVPFTPINREIEEQQGLRNRLDNLSILEVPGGADSQLADLFLRESIIPSRNHVVDSGDEEIRLYVLRQGLPYSAIEPIDRYKDRHDQYLANPGSVTPYTVPDAWQLPGIQPPRTNLVDHTLRLLYLSKALDSDILRVKPSGGCSLRFDNETATGFTISSNQDFPDFDATKTWLAKHVNVRHSMAAELIRRLDADPADYKSRLLIAWKGAAGEEKHFIQEELFRLRVDPANGAVGAGV